MNMKLLPLAPLALLAASAAAAQPPASAPPAWQTITMPTVAEAAAAFPAPPREYGTIHWAIWGGPQSKEKVLATIEHMYANGTYVIMIDNSRGLRPKYFTPEYLDLVKFTVDECKKRGMKVWIEGDAGYPDGFAGGRISRDYPQLGMQAIVADAHYSVVAGETLRTERAARHPRHPGVQPGVRAVPIAADPGRRPGPMDRPGAGDVGGGLRAPYLPQFAHPLRQSRRTTRPTRTASIRRSTTWIPRRPRRYINLIFETYAKLVGDEFGKTVLGFRGDETDFTGFMPWTPEAAGDLPAGEGLRPPALHRRNSSPRPSPRRPAGRRPTTGTSGARCSATTSTSRSPTGAPPAGWNT